MHLGMKVRGPYIGQAMLAAEQREVREMEACRTEASTTLSLQSMKNDQI